MKSSKRHRSNLDLTTGKDLYSLDQAIDLLKKCKTPKFDESVEISIKMGIDPKKSDQQVRGTVSLPNGTGQTVRVLVLAKGDKIEEALEAGADYAGDSELVEKISGGWTDFDAIVATPEMMREVGRLGKILGPRGLMPSPKAGTVTNDVKTAVQEIKAGKVEFKIDKSAVFNNAIGKVSFEKEKLVQNAKALLQAIFRAKPVGAKGAYFISMALSTTMGPGLKIESREFPVA